MTYKLSIPIDENGYTFTERSNFDFVPTKGGLSRSRLLFDGGAITLSLNWTCTQDEYNELINFWKAGTNYGAQSLLLDLIIDNADLTEYTANFVSAPALSKVNGLNYTVAGQFEVTTIAVDTVFDTAICAVFEAAYPAKPDGYLNLFSVIVNENWPEA